jgi:hypothetical protein
MTVVEKAILQSLDSMHNKFDEIARRVSALERKFADMDAFLDSEFGNHNEADHLYETREEYENEISDYQPHDWNDPEYDNMNTTEDSENYKHAPHVPSKDVNPAKRPANFSSAEDTPEYKKLQAELVRVQTFAQTQNALYCDLKKDFNNLSRDLQQTVQQAQNGPTQ